MLVITVEVGTRTKKDEIGVKWDDYGMQGINPSIRCQRNVLYDNYNAKEETCCVL